MACIRLLQQLEHHPIFQKSTTYEYFDEVNKVVLYDISENMSSLVHNIKYGVFNTEDPTTPGYYVVKFVPGPYMLQGNKTGNKKVINSGALIVNAVYLVMMKSNTYWYR